VAGGAVALGLLVLLAVLWLRSGRTPGADRRPEPAPPTSTPAQPPADGAGAAAAVGDPELALQGEYEGQVPGRGWTGVQVVARGGGTFAVVLLRGGLPGAGWNSVTPDELTAHLDNGKAAVPNDRWHRVIAAAQFTGSTPDGKAFALKRVVRRSPTLGAGPPAGAVVLLGGSGADAWTGGLTRDGVLTADATSKRGFKDFQAHFEFQLPFLPAERGQARANSGVFLQDRYEVQILDSFGLTPQSDDCGAVYKQATPSVNMALPPLSWQTYDLDFKAARFGPGGKKTANAVVSVRHNGVVIHQGRHLKGPTFSGKPEQDTPGPLRLQYHGSPVAFRNLWVVESR
jgi:hypothetical protein